MTVINNKNSLFLPVILGPTATGKTKLSLAIADNFATEIISADSMQVYKDMDIGTAKASKEIQNKVPHHMIDIITPDEEFSIASYQQKVDKLIPDIYAHNKIPLLVGGTGLYINAVIEGFLLPEMDNNQKLRKKLRQQAKDKGNEYVHKKLAEIDPELAQKLHPNDLRRVIRGIEIYEQTGNTKTYYIQKQKKRPAKYRAFKIGLYRDRENLYERINSRVEKMIDKGLVLEVKYLLANYDLSKTARQALGYKEIINYINNKYNLDEAIRIIKRDTRHLAKKQFTWFNRDKSIIWFNLSQMKQDDVIQDCIKLIRKNISDFKNQRTY